jgi:hypothetical protein
MSLSGDVSSQMIIFVAISIVLESQFIDISTKNVELFTDIEHSGERSDGLKKKEKNIQQTVFAGGHPPNY